MNKVNPEEVRNEMERIWRKEEEPKDKDKINDPMSASSVDTSSMN